MSPPVLPHDKDALAAALAPFIANLKASGEQSGRFDPRLYTYQMAAYAASLLLGHGVPFHPHEGQLVNWLYLFEQGPHPAGCYAVAETPKGWGVLWGKRGPRVPRANRWGAVGGGFPNPSPFSAAAEPEQPYKVAAREIYEESLGFIKPSPLKLLVDGLVSVIAFRTPDGGMQPLRDCVMTCFGITVPDWKIVDAMNAALKAKNEDAPEFTEFHWATAFDFSEDCTKVFGEEVAFPSNEVQLTLACIARGQAGTLPMLHI